MCKNIRTLYNFEPLATADEIQAAATQFVKKISGFSKPSSVNEKAFGRAINDIVRASSILLDSLVTTASPKNREIEATKAYARALRRFGPN